MDIFANLALGFSTALSLQNLFFVFAGASIGTLFGAFPGLSAPTAIALLLPVTFGLDPTSAIIMLAGIYYGASFGNAITAVLIGIPGDSAAVMTALEGYKLAQKGKAGHALTVSAVASFCACIMGVVVFAATGPTLAWWALSFGPPEYFSLIVMSFAMMPAFASQGRAKLLVSLGLGLVFALVGVDQFTARERFTFGMPELFSGIPFVPAIIGLFGIADIFYYAGMRRDQDEKPPIVRLRDMLPSIAEWRLLKGTILRGSVVGFIIGVLPGAGGTIAHFAAYAIERSVSKIRHLFGTGVLAGVAAAESGNSGAAIGAMVPLMTLGIPGSGTTAIMLGGFLIWGLQPGPMLFQSQPAFAWGLIASMFIGNIMLLFMNTVFVPFYARLLQVPTTILTALVVVFCSAGVYSVNTNLVDIWLMFGFGILGYFLNLLRFPTAPLVLGLVLGPLLEANMRQSFALSDNGFLIFLQRPISASLIFISTVLFFGPVVYDFVKTLLKKPSLAE
ncbi:MAG: tripartite tricarboxylate transporter permease [Rhodospirillales bacterium]|jgi:putative tricarboxylic transport membrane protein